MRIGLPSPLPTAIIHCPDCGVECNFVANCFAEMPFSYPGSYHPHEKGSQGCLKQQVRNLKKRIEQLTEENTGKKYLVHLWVSEPRRRHAVVIDRTPKDAIFRARRHEPNGGWEHANIEIITRVRASRGPQVLAMERKGFSSQALEEIYHASWAVIIDCAHRRQLPKIESLRRLQLALKPIQTQVRICNPYATILDETDKVASENDTGEKYLVHLVFADRHAVVIDNTPREAVQRARLYEPDGGWEYASVEIITRVRASRTAQVLAMDRLNKVT